MTPNQQEIIDLLSAEISKALDLCEHCRHAEVTNPDELVAYSKAYTKRVAILRTTRELLEDEFTIIHYAPR